MSSKIKDIIRYGSAIALLLFGCVLCIAGFVVDPAGVVDNSVLYIFGQVLLYAGSVFGISLFVDGRINKKIDERLSK